ncbi:MAG: CotH kinase family protein [Bacteroidales bacterium]
MKAIFSIRILALLLTAILTFSSCVDVSDLIDDDSDYIEPPITYVFSDVDSLKFISYRIDDTINPKIYSDVFFTYHSDDNKYKADIQYYHTDLSSLKSIYRTNATRVTVNDISQISGYTPNNFNNVITYRLYTINGNYKDVTFQLTNNCNLDIPLIVINTEKAKPIENRDDWIPGKMFIDKQLTNETEYIGKIEIKGRGNASWHAPKKPYALKLNIESGLLGMNSHRKWVLISNPRDKTLLRNRVALEIAKRTDLAWVPDCKYVNVILNNTFIGCYLLTEKIEIGPNRVNIQELTSNDITGGYLLEADRYPNDIDVPQFISQYANLPFSIEEQDNPNSTQMNYITNYINNIEDMLFNNIQIDTNYRNFIDLNSFVDFWIVNELVYNTEVMTPHSCFMYKDKSKKLFAGPVWDFDMFTFQDKKNYACMNYLWYKKLFSDPYFKALAKQRWQQFKPSLETIISYINQQELYITSSANMNWSIWVIDNNDNTDSTLPWTEAVERMKTNYTNRLNWLDAQISTW